jgi:transcriptional regulator of acetoin/glycerol metabolism
MAQPWETPNSVQVVRTGWEAFHRGIIPADGVRLSVLRSWERSLLAGVGPGQKGGGSVWSEGQLQQALTRNGALIAAATPVMADLTRPLAGSGQVLVLCDAAARVLSVDGAPADVAAAAEVGLVPGSDWAECGSGTNAMGTSLVEATGITIYATEHYVETLHDWSCVAAPIRHPITGEVLGIFDLSGQAMTVTSHTEMAVTGAVQAIEARLAILEATFRQLLLEAFADELARGRHRSLAAVDRYGCLVRAAGTELPPPTETTFWIRNAELTRQSPGEQRAAWRGPDGALTYVRFQPVERNGAVIGALAEVTTAPGPKSASAPASGERLPLATGLVGSNPTWLAALERAARVARTESTMLITGETGTGKEVLARAIHQASSRAAGPFIAINCGALPPNLVASELFGYVGGAFSGANPKGSAGKVEAAQGGTLFLDEVCELPPEAQVSLLRVLQEREVVRVGSYQPIAVNVRVLAATNRDLAELVARGAFRQDLFFRLNVVPVRLPPLRERREDILPLLESGYRRLGAQPPHLGFTSCERLTAYAWPGNVRELLNLVEQAAALGEDPADLLPLPPLRTAPVSGETGEAERIRHALAEAGGNAAAAARLLGMSRSTLYRKLELYDIRIGRQVT